VASSSSGAPSQWLLDHLRLLPPGGRVLDVACGRGRHALFLARRGFRVHALDRDADAVAELRAIASKERLAVTSEVVDLETEPPPSLGRGRFDGIVVVRYLHRPLFPSLIEALAPGGWLIYETFTTAQALRGHPTNPRFLLKPGELPQLVAPLSIVAAREADVDGMAVASAIATRPRR
jgi:SAM-dependent methyltransferase